MLILKKYINRKVPSFPGGIQHIDLESSWPAGMGASGRGGKWGQLYLDNNKKKRERKKSIWPKKIGLMTSPRYQ